MKRNADDNEKQDDSVSRMMGSYGSYWPQLWRMWNNYRYWPWYGIYWNSYNWMWNSYWPFFFAKDGQQGRDKEHVLSKRSVHGSSDDQVSRMMGGYGGYWPQWWNMWNNYRHWPRYWSNNKNWNNDWIWNRFSNWFPYSSYYFSQNTWNGNGQHTIFKRHAEKADTDKYKDEEKVAHMMGYYQQPYWPESWNTWHKYRHQPNYWNSQPDWNNEWNSNMWMWLRNQGQFPQNSLFDQQTMGPDFPYISDNQHHRWSLGNSIDSVLPFHPFAFSNGGKDAHQSRDSLFNKHREKRNSDSSLSENKTVENSTNSNNDTISASEPDVARQTTGYAGSSGNPYQQQWMRLYRLYLNSRPRYWRFSPYFSVYGGPYDIYRSRYGNRYGSLYYVQYVMPWEAYRYWYRQMWNNRLLERQWIWDQNKYDPTWSDYTTRNSPISYSWEDSMPTFKPDIRQQKDNAATPLKEEAQGQQEAGDAEEKRTKRSMSGMNYESRYPYQQGSMLGHNNFYNQWPSWWGYGMYNYNYWPWWNYFWFSPMWNRWNWSNNWMWSGYNNQPFMYSQGQKSFYMKTEQEKDDKISSVDQNENPTPNDSDRFKRSAEQQATEPETNAKVSRWMNVPEQFYSQSRWQQNSWNSQIPGWMGGKPEPGFNYFHPGFTDRNGWNGKFMKMNRLKRPTDQDMHRSRMDNFNTFLFSEGSKETEKESSRERQERSAEESSPAQSYIDSADPEVSRWMSGYPPMSAMSVRMYPWPPGMRQDWQYHGYNSQRQWTTWNRWGQSNFWDNWNSAYTTSVPSFPFRFSSGDDDDDTIVETIRQKRSIDDSLDNQRDDSKEEVDPKVSRMGMGFGWISSYPKGWKKYGPRSFNRQRMRYSWPMFNSYTYMPWGLRWNGRNQFQPGQQWNQKQFYPQWNMPVWNWRNDGQMKHENNWNTFHNFQNKKNHFNNEHVDESVFDPLSSFYFSQKDTKDKGSEDERLEKSMAEKATSADSQTTDSQQKESRTKRSAVSLSRLLSKGEPQTEKQKLNFATMLKPNRRFAKRSVPYKVKRFSPEATARLKKRFQKRSPTSTPDTTTDGTKPTSLETAPKMLMRATAPARGQSTRDREWGPSRGSGFPPNPTTNSRLPNQNELPNLNHNSNRGSNLGPGSGTGLDPFGDYSGLDGWNWDQPGWDGNPNWLGEQDPGHTPDGQEGDGKIHDGKGPQDRSSDMTIGTTTTATDGKPSTNIPGGSILNGDPRNRLSNYNYIDFNNPNYWNQFYNPASYNSTTGGPLGNATEWDNWFGLWAYGPNFWDDMNDLDLWDAPWGSGSWGMGPGGDRWSGGNWWWDPASGFSSSLPVEMGWETYWLNDCDDGDWGSGDLGYRPWNIRSWWIPEPEITYVDLYPNDLYAGACRDCFRPYSPVHRRYHYSFHPTRYYVLNSLNALHPARIPYRPSRFFRPTVRPMGSSRRPWLKRFPGYPWDSYGPSGVASPGGVGIQTVSGTPGATASSTTTAWTTRSAGTAGPHHPPQASTPYDPRQQPSTSWLPPRLPSTRNGGLQSTPPPSPRPSTTRRTTTTRDWWAPSSTQAGWARTSALPWWDPTTTTTGPDGVSAVIPPLGASRPPWVTAGTDSRGGIRTTGTWPLHVTTSPAFRTEATWLVHETSSVGLEEVQTSQPGWGEVRTSQPGWGEVRTSKSEWGEVRTSPLGWGEVQTSHPGWQEIGTSRPEWRESGTSQPGRVQVPSSQSVWQETETSQTEWQKFPTSQPGWREPGTSHPGWQELPTSHPDHPGWQKAGTSSEGWGRGEAATGDSPPHPSLSIPDREDQRRSGMEKSSSGHPAQASTQDPCVKKVVTLLEILKKTQPGADGPHHGN